MSVEKLHETLDELHRQLAHADSLDAKARDHLENAVTEIRAALAAAGDRPDAEPGSAPDEGVVDRLRDWKERLENDHPLLTATLVDLIATLRTMGF